MQEFSEYVHITHICMTIGRIALIFASRKFPSICRFYIYYQTIFLSLEWCLPLNYGEVADKILYRDNFLYFSLLYYDFMPSFISFILPVVVQSIMGNLHYG